MEMKKITSKNILLIVTLFVIALVSLRLTWIYIYKVPNQPLAKNGVLDLSEWDFKKDEVLKLDGEWRFYPNKIITPSDNETDAINKTILNVPNTWKDSEEIAKKNGAMGFGTYKLKIKLPDLGEEIYGMKIQDISTAAKIYSEDQLIFEQGKLAIHSKNHKGTLGSFPVYFTEDSNEINLTINISNHDLYNRGGIMDSIQFGLDDAINQSVNQKKIIQYFVIFFLTLHSFYALVLYSFGQKRRELVYFALLLISSTLYVSVTGDRLLLNWIDIKPLFLLKTEFLSYLFISIFILLFNKTIIYPDYKRIFNWFIIILSILAFTVVISPPVFLKIALGLIIGTNLVLFSVLIRFLYINIKKNHGYMIFILLSLIATIHNILWGLTKSFGLVTSIYYPLDFIIAVITFTFFVFAYHSKISRENIKRAKELERVDEKRDEFLINTSHELRNPLHALINISQAILESDSDNLTGENKDNLKLLIKICRRMNFTLNDLNDSVRLKTSDVQLYPKSINLTAVSTGVLDMVSFLLDEKDIKLLNEIPEDFPNIHADEDRLIQILFNLIHNAIKFTDKGTIIISATQSNNKATINIKDTGIGMSKEFIRKSFTPYEQATAEKTSRGSGIGLGLSIVKELINLQGGEIKVTSKLNVGSEFSFQLPLVTSDSKEVIKPVIFSEDTSTSLTTSNDAKIEAKGTITEPTNNINRNNSIDKAKILLVDDEALNLRVIKQILKLDYEVHTATSGEEALMKLQSMNEWDLIISDIMMPNMSGYELTRKVREQFTLAELPVLLLTARSQIEDIHTAFRYGANDYLIKPVDSLELKARVKALTELKKAIKNQLRTEAAWLQAQIRPHFLFNTLNTIASLSEIDTDKMVDLLREFGSYLQKSFTVNNTNTFVTIKDELELTKSYLYIEKQRFGDRLHVDWEIEDGVEDTEIPPLTIQPIIENAVMHGVLKRSEGGTVTISIIKHLDSIKVSIIDDGVGMNDQTLSKLLATSTRPTKGVGVSNTNRRLIQLFGSGLNIESEENIGTTVSFIIPNSL